MYKILIGAILLLAVVGLFYIWIIADQTSMKELTCSELEQRMIDTEEMGIGSLEHISAHYVAQCLVP